MERSRPNERLDACLRERFPQMSRGAIQRLIEQGHIRVNGRPVKATHAPRKGEEIEVRWPTPAAPEARPEEIPLNVLHEDAALLVVDKPAGLVAHPSAGHDSHTLVNALLHHCAGSLSGIGGVARPGIVHRLDKETSGCLVAAKSDEAHLALAEQFKQRRVKKVYEAIAVGRVRPKEGTISAAIARHPSHRKRMAVADGGGRPAQTSYRTIEEFAGAALVEAILHTGRTHQIRVHFRHLGFPLAGDELYGNRATRRLSAETGCEFARVMLHARRLAFVHPLTGVFMEFEAPRPKDFAEALDGLRAAESRAKGGSLLEHSQSSRI